LNEIILFKNFDAKDISKIVKLEADKLSDKLKDRNIKISITPKVSSFIAESAALEKMGARPVKRLIQKHIENKLSKLLLSKDLKDNQNIKFSFSKEDIIYNITEAKV
jgi:ATP-dependent Clp protease ATP-binding subunit ClpA